MHFVVYLIWIGWFECVLDLAFGGVLCLVYGWFELALVLTVLLLTGVVLILVLFVFGEWCFVVF